MAQVTLLGSCQSADQASEPALAFAPGQPTSDCNSKTKRETCYDMDRRHGISG